MPSRELADAALVLVGGTLLLTPGFVTDIVGLLLHPAAHPAAGPAAGSRPWSRAGCSARGESSGGDGTGGVGRPGRRPRRPAARARRGPGRGRRPRAAGRRGIRADEAVPGVAVGRGQAVRLRRGSRRGIAQQRQALLEDLLELGDGAALEQHVPVGADGA